MAMKKWRKRGILGILLLAVLSIEGTLAYFTSKDDADNQVTVGHNTIDIVEEFPEVPDIEPGGIYPKKVEIKNTGPVPCYTRVRITFSNSQIESVVHLDFNTKEWEKKGDFYYYKQVIEPGEKTSPLITQAEISQDVKEEDLTEFDIQVYAESCQQGEHMDYSSAWEEFERNRGKET